DELDLMLGAGRHVFLERQLISLQVRLAEVDDCRGAAQALNSTDAHRLCVCHLGGCNETGGERTGKAKLRGNHVVSWRFGSVMSPTTNICPIVAVTLLRVTVTQLSKQRQDCLLAQRHRTVYRVLRTLLKPRPTMAGAQEPPRSETC